LSSLRLEPDTWWHIKFGEEILTAGQWAKLDAYSFTAYGHNQLSFEWLGEVALALAYRLGHLQGLELLLLVLTSTILLLLYYYAYLQCGNFKAAFCGTLLVSLLAALCFTLRPQLIGYIFLLITLICLERYRQGIQKSLWVLPFIFLIWVNTHGSFALGLFVFGLYWVSGLVEFSWGGLVAERWRPDQRIHLALIFLLSILVLPLTPYGASAAIFPIEKALYFPLSGARINEWQPLNFSQLQPKIALFCLLGFASAQTLSRTAYRLQTFGLFVFAAYAAAVHTRFIILFAVAFAPVAATMLSRRTSPYQPANDRYAVNSLLILVLAMGLVRYFPSQAELGNKVAKDYPVQAVEYLQQHRVPGPMFNDYGFGGYLIWTMGPDHKVFIDGRGDFYEYAGVLSDYFSITDIKPQGLTLLDFYGIRSCLTSNGDPLATLLRARNDWQEVYRDKLAVLFVRR